MTLVIVVMAWQWEFLTLPSVRILQFLARVKVKEVKIVNHRETRLATAARVRKHCQSDSETQPAILGPLDCWG